MRLQAMRVPSPSQRHVTDVEFAGRGARAPMRGVLGLGLERDLDDFLSQFGSDSPSAGAAAGILGHARQPLLLKTPAPQDDRRTRNAKLPGDGRIGFPFHGA